jgi:flagellin-like protein
MRAYSVLGGKNRGVSPVVGAVLMVAVVIILAALVGAFALDFGGETENSDAPTASVEAEASGSNISFSLESGETLDADHLSYAGDIQADAFGSQEQVTGRREQFAYNCRVYC